MFDQKWAGKADFIRFIGLALVLTFALPAQARADGSKTISCFGGWGSFTCVKIYRDGVTHPNIRPVPQVRGESEIDESEERDRRWAARCRPIARHDAYGVKRFEYAAAGCEYGRYE